MLAIRFPGKKSLFGKSPHLRQIGAADGQAPIRSGKSIKINLLENKGILEAVHTSSGEIIA
jgi:hypothetical protein